MTREEKILMVKELMYECEANDSNIKTVATKIVDAIIEPEIGMYGRAGNSNGVWYGRLESIINDVDFPYEVGSFFARQFTPIYGLKEFLEEAELGEYSPESQASIRRGLSQTDAKDIGSFSTYAPWAEK